MTVPIVRFTTTGDQTPKIDGVTKPLPAVPEARALQQRIATWASPPPTPDPVTVIGAHGLDPMGAW